MPHTLEDTIIMDASWFKEPRLNTFIHEITHIHQRETPFEFDELYNNLGYKEVNDISNIRGLESILQLNRNNPDGLNANWIWKFPANNDKTDNLTESNNWWWIGAIFNSIAPNNLSDISCVALKLDMDKEGNYYYLKQQPMKLFNLSVFINFFGDSPNNYHPNEMAAKLAEWYLNYNLAVVDNENNNNNNNNNGNKQFEKYPGFQIFNEKFNALIKKYY